MKIHTKQIIQGGIIMKKIFFYSTVFFVLLSSPCLAGEWNLTGSLNQGRECFCSVILDDGRVLVAGGYNSGKLSSCEIYNPNAGQWTTTDSMNYARTNFSLTKLVDGKVLATAGSGINGSLAGIKSEIFNPSTEAWGQVATLNDGRSSHRAILLQSGKVLVVGGDHDNYCKNCEIYDPETNEWTLTGSCIYPKDSHTLELLPDGRVMAIGGGNSSYEHCEIYDPDTEIWTEIASLNEPRYSHTSHLLPNGDVMAIAGAPSPYRSSCEIYDFQTQEWTFADSLEIGRTCHCSKLLLNNKILVMGGQGETGSGSGYSCEIYNPITNLWQTEVSMNHTRSNFISEILLNEQVLVTGGNCFPVPSEIYTWNYTPIVSQPQGPNQGIIGEELIFSVTATDPDSDSISVRIDWGDDEFSQWTGLEPSGATFELSHSYAQYGNYEIRAQTADQWYFLNELCHNSISEWSEPLIVNINGIPEISISVDSLNFGTVYIGSDSLITIMVSNVGNGTLTVDAYTNTNEFSVYPANFNIGPDENLDIEIIFAPTYEGVIIDTLIILSNDLTNPEIQIELIGEGKILTGINDNEILSLSHSIKIYPNPFNSETTISFSNQQSTINNQQFSISIFNIRGQVVKTWSLNQTTPRVVWNGKDDASKSVTSGIYFCKYHTGGLSSTKKIILLK